mgnify:CR=1 FL=1
MQIRQNQSFFRPDAPHPPAFVLGVLGRGAAGRAPVAAGTFRSGTAAPDTGHSAGISAHGAGSAVADSAGIWLVPAWLAWTVCGWRLWYHCTGAVSLLPRCRPAGTGKRLVLALQNTLLRTLLLQTVTLCLFGGIPAGANRRPPHRGCSVSVLGGAAVGAGGAVSAGLGLCLSGAVVCALCLLCPSGTAALESARCCHADHARRSAGTAGTAGVVCPANAAAGDAPVGAAESGAVGDGVLQSAVPSVV